MFRLAGSELGFLAKLNEDVASLIGMDLTVSAHSWKKIPFRGIKEKPILHALLEAARLEGDFVPFKRHF